MKRGGLFGLLCGIAVVWPDAIRAQQLTMPVIGFLAAAESAQSPLVSSFRQGLREAGFVEGQNVAIEYRWAEGHYDRLPALAAELVRRQVVVIVASGGNPSASAAKAATTTIPIVFTAVGNPVGGGLVASLSRPGGNVTGIGALTVELDAKRLELLVELVPTATVIGALINPERPDSAAQLKGLQAAASAAGRQLVVVSARTDHELDWAYLTLVRQRVGALVVAADPFFTSRRAHLVALAARHALPTIYQFRDMALVGGLMSYGASLSDSNRQAGIYVGKILNGAKPADLPVLQPTKFELVVNLKTAKALGLTVPQSLLLRADEVIQ